MESALNKPMQLRLPVDLKSRIARIAERNHLSEADVVRLCLAQTIPVIEEQGLTVMPVNKPRRAAIKASHSVGGNGKASRT